MKPKVIKTEADYEAALARLEHVFDAKPGTPEGDELELLTMLVEAYEDKTYPMSLPDPISAIRFRMDQQGLKPKDLVPYIGSASKVSEVLSGTRTLSLSMIRSLVFDLGIPAEVLLQKPGATLDPRDPLLHPKKYPLVKMLKLGWFESFHGSLAEAKEQGAELLAAFAAALGKNALCPALNRQHVRSDAQPSEYALTAWRIRVATLALRENLPPYRRGSVTADFLAQLIHLSYMSDGPKLAKEFLNKNGIHLIVQPHLPKTYLDGAAIRLPNASPLVALTLRFDRLDNFWFTLLHELAHISLHLDKDDTDVFFDNLRATGTAKVEQEADAFASEALIPSAKWAASGLTRHHTKEKVCALAEELRISPAIPAGRIRFQQDNYKLLNELVGARKVRKMFA